MTDWYSTDQDERIVVVMTYGPDGPAPQPIDVVLTRSVTRPIGRTQLWKLQTELRISAAEDKRKT